MECKKCASSATITIRKKDSYCNNCFIANTNHKFRACIAKNKILSKNEKVLVCLSGGLSSTVLLDLVCNGISLDSHKKLRTIPSFLHLIGVEADSVSKASNIVKQCSKYKFDMHLVHISEYMKDNLNLTTTHTVPSADNVMKEQFNFLLKSLPSTTYNDFLLKIQRTLFIKCAEKLGCSLVFTGETTATLAMNLLSNLALGRGSQVEHDVGFCDARNRKIKIIKPMKDISQEELNYYSTIKQLSPIRYDQIKANSLQSVIGNFVTELQNTFPATISTVCKTADKIGNHDQQENKENCVICESEFGKQKSNLTALEATMFSRTISNRRPQKNDDCSIDPTDYECIDDFNKSLFPHINENLCYGCSRNYLETDSHRMPNHVKSLLYNK